MGRQTEHAPPVAGEKAVLDDSSRVDATPHSRPDPKQVDKIVTGAFVPALQSDDVRVDAQLGDRYSHRVRVTNDGAAPKGTKYRWSHSVTGATKRDAGIPDLEGASTFYPFVVRGVGEYRVISKVQYGPANGPTEETKIETRVVVGKLTEHQTALETEKHGQRRPFAGNMLVGEDLVLTTQHRELRRAGPELEDVHASFAAPGLVLKSVKTLASGIYEARLHASSPGGALGHLAVLPFDTKLGDTPIHVIRADISHADDPSNEDRRPYDFDQAKNWLAENYRYMFNEMRAGARALNMQSQINDPPPKQALWIEILLGCATAALGGAFAGVSLAVAARLTKGIGGAIEEGVKSFLEQGLAAAVTATFAKDEIGHNAPHVSFFLLQESGINTKQRDFTTTHFANVLVPQLDALERAERGTGFRKAMDLDRALRAEAPNVKKTQYDVSFDKWVTFVTKGQLGERSNPTDPTAESGTHMGTQVIRDSRGQLPSTPGVIEIELNGMDVYDPKTPVKIRRARMPGFNEGLRSQISKYKVKDIPFALRVRGSAPGRYDAAYAFARNEHRVYWLSKDDHEYLERKAGGAALDGAVKILEEEIGNEHITPES